MVAVATVAKSVLELGAATTPLRLLIRKKEAPPNEGVPVTVLTVVAPLGWVGASLNACPKDTPEADPSARDARMAECSAEELIDERISFWNRALQPKTTRNDFLSGRGLGQALKQTLLVESAVWAFATGWPGDR